MAKAQMVRVRARTNHTDATQNVPRTTGEVYAMEKGRARLKARQGFIDLLDADGRVVAPDVPDADLPVVDEAEEPEVVAAASASVADVARAARAAEREEEKASPSRKRGK